MKRILIALLLVPSLASAQSVTQADLDGAAATVTRTVIGLTNQVAVDQTRVAQLTQQVQELQREVARLQAEVSRKESKPQ